MIVKEEFIKYLMGLDLYSQYIGDISKCTNFINVLENEYQQAFHSNPFDITDISTDIQLISSNLKQKRILSPYIVKRQEMEFLELL